MTDPAIAFLTVYAVIAGVELTDRTNFSLIGLAAREPPLAVWSGAAIAFLATTVLSVVVGSALLLVLGGDVVFLRLGGGIVLLAYAAYLALKTEAETERIRRSSVFVTAFLLIFLLELGDTTMVLTMTFLFSIPNPVLVGVAAAAGLVTVASVATVIGSRLGEKVEPRVLERVVSVVLTIVGVVTIVYALFPSAFPSV